MPGSNPIFFPPAPEGDGVHPQNPGRLFQRLRGRQYLADMILFDALQGNEVAYFGLSRHRRQMNRHIFHPDGFPRGKQDGTLEDITQLPDVAGPRVMLQDQMGLLGETQKAAMVLPGEKGKKTLCQGRISSWRSRKGGMIISTTFRR